MLSLVEYDSSDDESKEISIKKSEPSTHVSKFPIHNNNEKLELINKLNKFKTQKKENFNYIDENFYMKLESEINGETELISDFKTLPKEAPKYEQNTKFSIPEPIGSRNVQCIDLDTQFLEIVDPDNLPNPEKFNLDLIKPEEKSEISANYLIQSGLLTGVEQAGIKRKQNMEIGTITAKKICMDDLTSDRPIDLKPGLSAEELSKFRTLKEEEPDKNSTRQHQITWLSHKAREREFALNNHLSEHTFTQKESRSKYGF